MGLGQQITETASAAERTADEALFSEKEEKNVESVSRGEADAGEEEGEETETPGGGEGSEEGGEGDEETEEADEEVDEEDEEEEVDEEEEDEEEKDKDKDEEEEKKEAKPAKKRIYDETFEKFPKLKEAFDRNKAYSEVFASPEEARLAVTDLARYERMAMALEAGNPLNVFNALYNKDPKIVQSLARNFIPSLLQVHPKLAAMAALPSFDAILRQARGAASGLEGRAKDNLENSVDHLCKFIHGKPYGEYMEEQKNKPGLDPRVEQLQRELEESKDKEFNNYYSRVADTCYRRLDRVIAKAVSNIPKLSILERKALARFVKEDVTEQLDKDRTHSTRMGSIWRRIVQGGLKDEQSAEVINAFLGGARQLMKPVLAKRLAEARRGRRPSKGGGAGAPPRVPAGAGAQGASSQKRVGPIDPSKVDYRHTSDMDIFSGDIKYKK